MGVGGQNLREKPHEVNYKQNKTGECMQVRVKKWSPERKRGGEKE